MSAISVVVPIYNAEKCLDKCIKSIINQTFKDIEIILVNDGSVDRSLDICKKYAAKDNRIKIINKKNEGSIIARRIGVMSASSNYITFVDSDDWINKDTLKIINEEILDENIDIVVFNMYRVIDSYGLIKKKNSDIYFKKQKIYADNEIKDKLAVAYLHGHPFSANLCGKVYKKDLLISSGNYLKKIKFFGEDLYYNLEMFLKVKKVSLINETLYYYRAGGNTSKYMPYMFNDMIEGYLIQKDVINKYYNREHYNGISIMLLNTFKTCLENIFLSRLSEYERKELISKYVSNEWLIESTKNLGAIQYFDNKYLGAIQNKEYDYLYNLGKVNFKSNYTKRIIKKIIGFL